MMMRGLTLALAFMGTAAAADPVCDDLWFTRNLIFDRAGYCFGSDLGRAVFDNADCTTSSPQLSRADRQAVEQIREVEAEWECQIDTSVVRRLEVDAQLRRSLSDLPVPTGYESGCMGWQVAPMPLYPDRDATLPVIGRIMPGDDVGFGHIGVGGWEYVTLWRNGKDGGEGWAFMGPYQSSRCVGWAG